MQFALVSLVKKMAIDHPYHAIFQVYKFYFFYCSEAYGMGYSFLSSVICLLTNFCVATDRLNE